MKNIAFAVLALISLAACDTSYSNPSDGGSSYLSEGSSSNEY